jgi:diadenosine tetraphosphate (Ap4A) HIT family hydrolase
MTEFTVDPRLTASSEPLASLRLCEARLQADARYAWIVLIPRKPGARELEHLTHKDRAARGRPVEKLNVGALGNKVSQLHVHVVGRRTDDPAWPEPVWGLPGGQAYGAAALAAAREAALPALEGVLGK